MLKAKKPYINSLVQNIREHRKELRIIKPTINIIRLLLCSEDSVEMFKEQF